MSQYFPKSYESSGENIKDELDIIMPRKLI